MIPLYRHHEYEKCTEQDVKNSHTFIISKPLWPLLKYVTYRRQSEMCAEHSEPEFLIGSWVRKPEVTSGQSRIFPLFNILQTRTNCSFGAMRTL